jgi:hypothetical protein
MIKQPDHRRKRRRQKQQQIKQQYREEVTHIPMKPPDEQREQPPSSAKTKLSSCINIITAAAAANGSSNNKNKNDHSKKSVSFCRTANVRFVPKLDTLSVGGESIRHLLWHSRPELREMKERTNLVVELLHHAIVSPYVYDNEEDENGDNVIQNDDFCSLGLESYFGLGREISQSLKSGGQAAVLLEQKVQLRDGRSCDELISTCYMEFSERAAEIARRRGLAMAKAAGDWVASGLPAEYVHFLYTNLRKYKSLAAFKKKSPDGPTSCDR